MKNDKKPKSRKNTANNSKKVVNNNVERHEEMHDHDVDFERVDEDASFKLI
jgi:hypothetical protein